MIAFDPERLDIKVDNSVIEEGGRPLIKSSWEMTVPTQNGTAWIRLTPELRDFFLLCKEQHDVIGFDYDFEEGGLNFGLILADKSEEDE